MRDGEGKVSVVSEEREKVRKLAKEKHREFPLIHYHSLSHLCSRTFPFKFPFFLSPLTSPK